MITLNIFLFLAACLMLWKASELVVKGVSVFSRSLKVSSFAVSFLVLGLLTSLTEISVGLNAVASRQPQIFVGNLIGGSVVILLLVIPLLAIFNRQIILKNHLGPKRLVFFLLLILSPSLLIIDGVVGRYDALLLVGLYALFFYIFQRSESVMENISPERLENKKVWINLGKIILGAVVIYAASSILVDRTSFLAGWLGIPPFLISLLVLSIGTNLPELVIAANAIRHRQTDVAFGNYVGSAAANPLLFGIFSIMHGPFTMDAVGFDVTLLIIMFGYILFFFFARSKNRITATEGLALLAVYLIFLFFQGSEILLLSTGV
jgi:cation:H+ antiporter